MQADRRLSISLHLAVPGKEHQLPHYDTDACWYDSPAMAALWCVSFTSLQASASRDRGHEEPTTDSLPPRDSLLRSIPKR